MESLQTKYEDLRNYYKGFYNIEMAFSAVMCFFERVEV